MAVDESCRQPGAVPFKWEIQPGVPKPHQHQSSIKPSPKLRPPPAGAGKNYYYYPSPLELGSFSTPSKSRLRSRSGRLKSDRVRFDRPNSVEVVSSSAGCFLPLLKRKGDNKKNGKTESVTTSEIDYSSDLETLARRSMSTRKMLSPFRDSVSSSSFFGSPSPFSSARSSPRAAGDAEWAAFGLF